MSTGYEVSWADTAADDLKGIIEYIAESNAANAKKILKKIKETASGLNRFPERGRIIPEFKDLGILLYRELVVDPWRIVYRISERNAFVLSVLDSRRNVEDILLKRFLS